jgi:hypothetical protein
MMYQPVDARLEGATIRRCVGKIAKSEKLKKSGLSGCSVKNTKSSQLSAVSRLLRC